MSDYTQINSLNLGNTFGAWYAKTNEMITRLNLLKVGGITGGDGILVRPQTSTQGGYTLDIASTISKNVTFNGNVTVNGILSSSFGGDVSGINVVLPANTGVTIGNIVYLDSTGKLEKALANDECTSEVVGVVVGFTGGNAQVATAGKVSGSTIISNFLGTVGATLQKGVVYFLSGGVSGAGTTLEPDVTDYVSKPMLLGLTGDSGLILPYRGYIGLTLSNGSSNNVVVGVSGGVSSLNGITASLWPAGTALPGRTISKLKTTGDLHAVIYQEIEGKKLTKATKLNIFSATTNSFFAPDSFSGGLPYFLNAAQNGFVEQEDTSSGTVYTNYGINNIDDGFLFSTSGITGDVYKLTNIKIIPRNISSAGEWNQNSKFTFSLQKEYNSVAGTTFINIKTGVRDNPPTTTYSSVSSYRLELKNKSYTIVGNVTDQNEEFSYTADSNTSELITPIIRNYPHTIIPPSGTVYGVTTGTIDATENGTFPLVYCSIWRKARPSSFNINNVILGGAGTNASKYIKASIENQWFTNQTGSEGYTMESALLGWNAQYGAVVESLYFVPVSILNSLTAANIASGIGSVAIQCDIILEMYKYDLNTKTTSGSPIMVQKKYTLTNTKTKFGGIIPTN
jgi:hypothetical protein